MKPISYIYVNKKQENNGHCWRHFQYASSCIPFTARPLGSFLPWKAVSQASASAVEQATLGTLGTLFAADALGKCGQYLFWLPHIPLDNLLQP